jgi:sugar O-acyltransferase (sialic acid O-acetyltransferase NeuD family)
LVAILMCGDLVIFGAWHFSQVLTEAAELNGWRVAGYVDPDPPGHVTTILEIPADVTGIASVGDNLLRAQVFGKLMEHRRKLTTLVHPSAVVSRTASIGLGSYVGENAVVRSNAVIGIGVFVNAGAVVSHDCKVGDFVTLGPNAAAAGHVTVGAQTLIGVGASIRPWVNIGSRCEIGAGAAVISDIPDDTAAIGVPARAVPKSTRAERQSDWSGNTVW